MAKLKNYPLIDLWPYKIKNRELFYDRNHPDKLHPDSKEYKEYWKPRIKKCVIGDWINDNGTWVYMYPVLYWYINIVKISDKASRNYIRRTTGGSIIYPRLRDNEWIIFTYDFVTDGFSGFKKDKEITCNQIVGMIQRGEEVDSILMNELTDDCYKENGELKKFIEPWDYLRTYYTIENPAKEPLGDPIYDNLLSNGLVLTSRSLGKSLISFPGKALHAFTFNGVKTWQEYKYIEENAYNFFIGSPKDDKVEKAITMIKTARRLLPGTYTYTENGRKKKLYSPFYVRTKGSWTSGESIERSYKEKGGAASDDEGSGSVMEFKSMIKHDIATGDRYYIVFVEEIGLLKFARSFYSSVRDSMRVGVKSGKMWGVGTGGDIEAVQDVKFMWQNIDNFEIFGIPNYWNPNSKITKIPLFLPVQYQDERYKDENGNTKLEEAHKAALIEEAKYYEGGIEEYKKHLMNNPFIPDHIFYTNTISPLPSEEASQRVAFLESGIWKEKAKIGWVIEDRLSPNGVKFIEDADKYKPILDYLNVDPKKMAADEQKGAVIMYEAPQYPIEKGLYTLIVDTVFKPMEGVSFNCAWIYKGVDAKGGMQDNIVMEWTGRIVDETLDKTFELFLNMAKLYGAKIYPEVNLDEFMRWITFTKKMGYLLIEEAYLVEKEIFVNYNRRKRVGFEMRGRKDKMPATCDRWQKEWLLEEVIPADIENNQNAVKRINTIYSIRYLNEVASYNEEGNFDNISVARGLMLLRKQNEMKDGIRSKTEEDDDENDIDNNIKNYEIKNNNYSFLDG